MQIARRLDLLVLPEESKCKNEVPPEHAYIGSYYAMVVTLGCRKATGAHKDGVEFLVHLCQSLDCEFFIVVIHCNGYFCAT